MISHEECGAFAAALRASGVTTVFGYPGWPAEVLLALLLETASDELSVHILSCEDAAVSAAHGHWLVTGRAAAVIICDGPGVEAAAGMLQLMSREGAGCLVVIPGLLPMVQSPAPILAAVGAMVLIGPQGIRATTVRAADDGQVVVILPAGAAAPTPTSRASLDRVSETDLAHPRSEQGVPVPPPQPDQEQGPQRGPACARRSNGSALVGDLDARRWIGRGHGTVQPAADHQAVLLGPLAGPEQLGELAGHSCPILTRPGVAPPAGLRTRWVGSLSFATSPQARALADSGTLATVGCTPGARSWLARHDFGAAVVDLSEAGACNFLQWPAPPPPIPPLRLAQVLVALAGQLPEAVIVADAGASHRIVGHLAQNLPLACVITTNLTTMGWSPGAAVGAGLGSGAPVVEVLGDGTLSHAGLQLADLGAQGLRGVIVLSVNGRLGSVDQRLRAAGAGPNTLARMRPLPFRPELLSRLLGYPYRWLGRDDDLAGGVEWAAAVTVAGGIALLAVDTAGDERAEYALPTGDPAVDQIVAATSA